MAEKHTLTLDQLIESKNIDTFLKPVGFEDGLKLLEELVTKVESGNFALEKAVVAYERGVALTGHLRELISGAEAKLKVLQEKK